MAAHVRALFYARAVHGAELNSFNVRLTRYPFVINHLSIKKNERMKSIIYGAPFGAKEKE
jgi:hypothetical protein